MEPFQIVYLSSNDQAATTSSMDEFTLQEITAAHLTATLRKADPDFIGLSLYHIVRSDSEHMFQNGTKVAYSGTIYYSSEHTPEQMLSAEYLSFLGHNETKYVSMLQDFGWEDLEHALLMSALGYMVELVDGDMVEREDDQIGLIEGQGSPQSMEKNMSVTMYLVAVLVPMAVIVTMGVTWAAYRARHHVTWNAPSSPTPSDPVWQSHHQKSDSLRQAQLELFRNAENLPDDTSQLSVDETSVRVTVQQ
jgi:hypothetical protein